MSDFDKWQHIFDIRTFSMRPCLLNSIITTPLEASGNHSTDFKANRYWCVCLTARPRRFRCLFTLHDRTQLPLTRHYTVPWSGVTNKPLTRNIKLRVAHAPGTPGTFFPPPRVSDPGTLHGTCGTHVPWCMPGSLTNVFLWSWWQGKRSRHSRRMHNPRLYVFDKRPMPQVVDVA